MVEVALVEEEAAMVVYEVARGMTVGAMVEDVEIALGVEGLVAGSRKVHSPH